MKILFRATAEASAAIATFDTALGLMVSQPCNERAAALELARDQALAAITRLQRAIVEACDDGLSGDLFGDAA